MILQKLKNQFGIDSMLLIFVREYLKNRTQNLVIENLKSSSMPVTSGVPQGSILGPLLFVLFINDISDGISNGTNLLMYADDTKIHTNEDHIILQKDIDYLLDWALCSSIKFHPSKSKVLTISICRPSLLDNLPFNKYQYSMGEMFTLNITKMKLIWA